MSKSLDSFIKILKSKTLNIILLNNSMEFYKCGQNKLMHLLNSEIY